MARIDKVTMAVRAPAGTAITGLHPVKLNSGGSVIPSGTADAVGVVCIAGTCAAGDPIAIIRAGEIVEFGGSAGASIFAIAGGSVGTTAGGSSLGFTVEANRFVVAM